jgi:hypothetical protein
MATERGEGERVECGCSLVYGELHVDELRLVFFFPLAAEETKQCFTPGVLERKWSAD